MLLAHPMVVVVVEGTGVVVEVGAVLVAGTSERNLHRLARVVALTMEAAVVAMVAPLHMGVVAMVVLALPVPGINVVVALS